MLHILLHRLSPTEDAPTPIRPTKRLRFSKLHDLRMYKLQIQDMYIWIHIPEPSSSVYHRSIYHEFMMIIITISLALSPPIHVAVAVMWVIRLYKAGKQHLELLFKKKKSNIWNYSLLVQACFLFNSSCVFICKYILLHIYICTDEKLQSFHCNIRISYIIYDH